MKGLGKIGLYALAALGIVGFLWTVFTMSWGTDAESEAANLGNAGIGFFIIIGLLAIFATLGLFILYKVVDLGKHPKHLKELLLIIGIIVVSFILGFVFSGFDGLMGASIMTFVILLVVSFGYLIFDTIRSLLK